MPIDTLKAARRLQEDDTFSPEQAERIAEILSDLDVASATKDDLDALEGRLTERIDQVESHLGDRIDDVEHRLENRLDRTADKLRDLIDRRHQEIKTFVMTRVGWAAGLLAVWIALPNYLMG